MTALDREKIISEYFDFAEIIDKCYTWDVLLKTGESAKCFGLVLTIRERNMTLYNDRTEWAGIYVPQGKSFFDDEDALRDGLEYIRLLLIHIWQGIMLSCKPRPQASTLD